MTGRIDLRWDTADGSRLRQAISDAGLSGRGLATRTGLNKNTVSAWMRGQGNPTVENLRRVASELSVQEYELLRDPPTPPPPGPPSDTVSHSVLSSSAARDAADHAADLLDRFDRLRADLAGVPDLLSALDSAQSAAEALRRAFADD